MSDLDLGMLALAAWCVGSIPLTVLTGRVLARCSAERPARGDGRSVERRRRPAA